MRTDIFIVTYRKDFEYLRFCLRSIGKFSTGFGSILLVPDRDFEMAVNMVREELPSCAVRSGDEWENKGMLWAMTQKVRADEHCPQSDLIFHIDADCVFTEPVTPSDYMEEDKPILLYESFDSLRRKRITELDKWQECTQRCLPFDVLYETMRRHPEVYHRGLYRRARELVESKTGSKFDDYVRAGVNSFPQSFCEFNTLGNVAMQCFPDKYHMVNLEHNPWPKAKLHQGWTHAGMRHEDMEVFKRIGIA